MTPWGLCSPRLEAKGTTSTHFCLEFGHSAIQRMHNHFWIKAIVRQPVLWTMQRWYDWFLIWYLISNHHTVPFRQNSDSSQRQKKLAAFRGWRRRWLTKSPWRKKHIVRPRCLQQILVKSRRLGEKMGQHQDLKIVWPTRLSTAQPRANQHPDACVSVRLHDPALKRYWPPQQSTCIYWKSIKLIYVPTSR